LQSFASVGAGTLAPRFDPPQSHAFAILGVIWAAGALATVFGLITYVAAQSYDPALSCHELYRKAFNGSEIPTNLDAWNDYELLCGAPPLS
jgi:hypothetical protein